MKKKVFVIGLDGATFDLIDPWKKYLPNISQIMREGVSSQLTSTIPPLTCPAWLCFMTGKGPDDLGVYDFLDHKIGEYNTKMVNPSYVKSSHSPIWDILSNEGARVGVFNVPCTYPPYEINGFIIAGMLTPSRESDFTYPKDLKNELSDHVGLFEFNIERIDEDKFLDELHVNLHKITQSIKYLQKKYNPDFFMAVFRETDAVQHFMWRHMDSEHPLHDPRKAERYKDSIKNVWVRIDQIIGEFLKMLDEDTTIILMSDHGFGSRDKIFYVNNWLEKMGYLKLNRGIRIGRLLISLLRRLGSEIQHPSFEERIDWTRTRAYSPPHTSAFGQIYVNLKERERYGIVEDGIEYEKLRSELIKNLSKIKNPLTAEKMKVEAFRREEIYSGEYVRKAPDIIYFMDNLRCVQSHHFNPNKIIEIKSRLKQNATHRMNGIFIIKGPNIKKGILLEGAHITDIAPTILHIMNAPIPRDKKGRILQEIFDDEK